MLRLPQNRSGPRELAARIDQVGGVERPPTVVALVASGVGVTAVGAGSLDVAIREEPTFLLVEELLRDVRVEVSVVEQGEEELLHDPAMGVGPGRGEEVPVDVEVFPVGEELGVELVDDLLRIDALFIRLDRDRRAVDVRPRHHEHVVATRSPIPGVDVGGEIRAGHVPEVQRALRIRPCNGHEHVLRVVFRHEADST